MTLAFVLAFCQELERQMLSSTGEVAGVAQSIVKLPMRGGNPLMSGATGGTATDHLYRDVPFRTYYIMATVGVDT